MKNTAINTLAYTGVVTLSQYIGQKKYKVATLHNEGGNSLFNFLADCLVGDFTIARSNKPSKIMLISRTANGSGDYTYTSASGFIFLLTDPEKVYDVASSGLNCRVRYSFIIPQDMIEGISLDNLGIGLYSYSETAPEAFAAYCELGVTTNSLINTALVVDWELIISNSSVQE